MPEYNENRKVNDLELLVAYIAVKFPGERGVGYRTNKNGINFYSQLLKMIYPRLFDNGKFLHLSLRRHTLRSKFYIGEYDSGREIKNIADAVAYKMFNRIVTTINREDDPFEEEDGLERPKIIHKFASALNNRAIYSGSEIYLEEEVFRDNLFSFRLGNYLEIFPDLLKECVDENYRF